MRKVEFRHSTSGVKETLDLRLAESRQRLGNDPDDHLYTHPLMPAPVNQPLVARAQLLTQTAATYNFAKEGISTVSSRSLFRNDNNCIRFIR